MSAIIFAHPRASVKFDPPPVTAESVEAAKREGAELRAAVGIPDEGIEIRPADLASMETATEAQWQRLEGFDAVYRLVQLHGVDRVQRWLEMASLIQTGKEAN